MTTGLPEGQGTGSMTFWNHLSYNSRNWAENGDLNIGVFEGLAQPASIKASFDCVTISGNCGVSPSPTTWALQTNFEPTTNNANYTGAQGFVSLTSAGTAYMNFETFLTITNPGFPPAFFTVGPTASTHQQRCDNFSYFTNSAGGCVYYQYSLYDFVESVSDPLVGDAAQVDYEGQQQPPYPGAYFLGGSPLTRDTSSTDQDANRRAARAVCGTSIQGLQCDEYPFASTHQGAAFGPFVARLIPQAPNQKEGVNLGLFYYHNRVAENDPFYVTITN